MKASLRFFIIGALFLNSLLSFSSEEDDKDKEESTDITAELWERYESSLSSTKDCPACKAKWWVDVGFALLLSEQENNIKAFQHLLIQKIDAEGLTIFMKSALGGFPDRLSYIAIFCQDLKRPLSLQDKGRDNIFHHLLIANWGEKLVSMIKILLEAKNIDTGEKIKALKQKGPEGSPLALAYQYEEKDAYELMKEFLKKYKEWKPEDHRPFEVQEEPLLLE